jgi:nucleoside-diphosphate-sugar epimerase
MRVLVTGANGFVGLQLCAAMLKQEWQVRAALRSLHQMPAGTESVIVGAIDGKTDWADALRGVDVVIHLAARVHVMKDTAADPLSEFLKVNLYGTTNMAQQAARAGVKRLVYVSSVKVNGEQTTGSHPFTESDEPNPQDPYAVSKWRAEQDLQRIAQETGLEVVTVRPPLVYGPGVKGNFIRLLDAIDRGISLPLAGANNLRSLVYVGNLVDALIACATHNAAAGQTYLVSDGNDVSTAMLVEKISKALGRKSRAFYFPPALLRAMAAVLGREEQVDRLFGSLRVNDEKIRRELAWFPPYTLEQGLRATAEWY